MPPETNSPINNNSKSTSSQVKILLGSLFTLFTGQGARQGYLAAIDQSVISLSNFVATIILARNVDPTQLGVYGVGFVTLRLVRAFQDGLIVQPMNVFGAGMTQDEFKRYASSTSARIALMVYLAKQGTLTGISGLEAIAWGAFVALIPSLWFTRNYWTRQIASLKGTWQKNWTFGRWLLGSFLANWAAVEFYPILTAGLISFAAAGAYRALQNLVAPVHLLLRAIDTFLTPRAAKLYEKGGLQALTHTLRSIYLAIVLPVLVILIIALAFPEQLLSLIYGEKFLEFSSGVTLMALFYALMFAYWPLQSIFKAAQLSRPIFVANILAIASMFTVGIWAILNWGVYGTIIGQGVNALVINLVLWGYWINLRKQKPGDS
jgi:O-antigen/teichoic acid export membrane protein